jgi:hypothetical protein
MLTSSPDPPRLVPALGSLGGQPRKNPPADAALHIRAFSGDGFSIVGIAEKFGIERKTLERWLADFPELKEAFDRGREKERHTLHNGLYRIATQTDDLKAASIAAMFLLKSRHGYREGDPGDQANRVSVTFNLPGALTLEQFAEAKNATPVIEISGTRPSDT